ncbi:MAG TPA: SMC-Scp complex subunit ScpB [Candidatus Margulisiibacteriota bacterium]|nr:SMC-Scp complex subunit ScpB [Candidatus Margulisiibacteriota bacterium]
MEEVSEELVTAAGDDGDIEDATAAAENDDVGRLAHIVESVLFAAAAPVSLRKLVDILEGPTPKEVQAAMARLKQVYAPGQRGILLLEVAGGYQFRTARENASWVRAVFRDKPMRLGRAALETLAIIAYKQPVTRAEIEAIRGVDVDGVLSTLLARRLVKIAGRKEAVGRPLLYTTTPEFLETFGLKDLKELPSLKELGPAPDDGEITETAAANEPHENAAMDAAPGVEPAEAAAQPAERDVAAGADSGSATPAEDSEPSGDRLAPQGGGADPDGPRPGEWEGGDGAGDEGESPDRPDHD